MIVLKWRPVEERGFVAERTDNKQDLLGLIEGIIEHGPGNSFVIEVVEMTERAFSSLPEHQGW